ncbi:hypothetical protein HER10_EVM0012827 [Colletotrichum scovillei]|uniref:uncharacterized protein n=1 Tax=Colletotrichum scovillei TaxID=1209932 RepID=UPI0015C2C966|nr:uncharacterized protein HER10_EVM0012827 [Colletotrichum scovillei]KAF4780553.1 hypothetical protein HER10_EVM0012827 [Colletotrichum scovillei]
MSWKADRLGPEVDDNIVVQSPSRGRSFHLNGLNMSPIDGFSHGHSMSSISLRPYGTEEHGMLGRDVSRNLLHRSSSHGRPGIAPTSSSTHLNQLSGYLPLLGKPTIKKGFYYSDLEMAILSFICLTLETLVVFHESISVGNDQLIVFGFLLSTMHLCLGSVAPILFVLMEARFGDSAIQNYDGLLRNKPTASRLGTSWRVALLLMLALPIALSVAYKTFTGGESRMEIDSFDYISNKTYYGMFQPPGILLFDGVSGFFNATTAFRGATKLSSNGSKPPFPTLPRAYGYNTLLLNETSAAALDTLQADYVIAIQERLAIGES